ncbi:unnamed protein product, partial [marine sediment metagenome]
IRTHIERIRKKDGDIFESKHITKDGKRRNILVNSKPITIGGKVYFQSIMRDITERQRIEETLRESKARLVESNQLLEGVLEHTHMMAVFLDPQFNFIWVNHAYAETCRHEPSFFPGKNHFALYPGKEVQAIFQRVLDTGEPFYVEANPFEFHDQPERGVTYWNWSLMPVKDGTGKVTGLVFTLAEVTGRIWAEEKLRESEKHLQSVFQTMVEGVLLIAPDGKIVEANSAAERILGLS